MALFYRRLPRFEYLAPGSVEETLSLLREHRGDARLCAGGTDLIPQLKNRQISAQYVVDLKRIPGLDAVHYDQGKGMRIGALTTISAIEQATPVRDHFPCLAQAASVMASPQVRNRGTFAGNICNQQPGTVRFNFYKINKVAADFIRRTRKKHN